MEPVAVEFTLRDLGLGGKVVYEMGTSLEAVMGDVPMWAFSPDEIETSRQVPLAAVNTRPSPACMRSIPSPHMPMRRLLFTSTS